MLLLLFRAGKERFGLDTSVVTEVTPVPVLRPVPSAPDYVRGLFDYRGAVTPVIDLSVLLGGSPAQMLLSTRVAVVRYRENRRLGLLLESATETWSCRAEDIEPAGIAVDGAPYLGGILRTPEGMLQCVTVDRLLPAHIRERLPGQDD